MKVNFQVLRRLVGKAVIKSLVDEGYDVIAAARRENAVEVVDPEHVTVQHLDFHDSLAKIEDEIGHPDAVIFVAGSRGKDLLQTDLNGAVKLMKAAEANGVKRYVQLSSAFALDQDKWAEIPSLASIIDYDIAKYFSDEWLIHNTNLDYTIIQPGNLMEKQATGKTSFTPEGGENSIDDVAQVLVDSLKYDNTIHQVIIMHDGDTPIDEALSKVK
ncbi:NAD(P)H-binding protein [Lactobacillus crispatus]|nr:NAD(P)H-binding protein [Lactobacillus crispatus]KAA8795130.1 NAD(P)H-binding protein [Lactobacillus crispatus]KAA8809807.1 NAD(P)H-binding protein [Lactobacillus crispatus]